MTTATPWKRNLYILWLGNFIAGIAFNLLMPFLPLFINTLGHFSKNSLNLWNGVAYSSTFLVSALIAPLWGRLADKKGRKLMLLRSSLGMAVVNLAMAFVTNTWQLVFARVLIGLFSGYVPSASALIATEVPQNQSGKALGFLTTGNISGTLLGPLLGGAIASVWGYRSTFIITGILLLIVFFLSLILVKEHFTPLSEEKAKLSFKQIMASTQHENVIWGMMLTTLIIQTAITMVNPFLTLFIRELMHFHGPITMVSGVIAATPGFATVLIAAKLGDIGDHIGTARIIKIALGLGVIVFILSAIVTNVWQLWGLRFIIGLADAALLPGVQTMLIKMTPKESVGTIFSYSQSAQGFGSVIGPMMGALLAGIIDYRGTFVVNAVLLLVTLIVLMMIHRANEKLKSAL